MAKMQTMPKDALTPAQKRIAERMLEADLQDGVVQLAEALGYMVHHIRDSRGQNVDGWPDLFLLPTRPPGPPIYLELKSEKGELTTGRFARLQGERGAWIRGQTDWRDALVAAGQRWFLWRPSDWISGTIQKVLEYTDQGSFTRKPS